MMAPLKVVASLRSPLSGDAPALDALLEYQLGMLMGMACKITRDKPLKENEFVPIPLSKHKLPDGRFFWGASNPIMAKPDAVFVEHHHKRFETHESILVHPDYRKSILTGGGPYKSRRVPSTIYRVDRIAWFCHGDRKEIRKLLKKITAIGKDRSMGYGQIEEWNVEESEEDYSIVAGVERVLMKTLPVEEAERRKATAWTKNFGGFRPPYWHPDNYMEIAVPC